MLLLLPLAFVRQAPGLASGGAPTAADDPNYYTTTETRLYRGPSVGVLPNDSDSESDPLTAEIVTNPGHAAPDGFIFYPATGAFDYTPEEDYWGVDQFTYKAWDGTSYSNVATVTITVNNRPVAVDDSYQFAPGSPTHTVSTPGVKWNDTDAEGSTLYTFLDTQTGQGSVSLVNNGSFTYTPPTSTWRGQTSFTYHCTDGQAGGNVATVTLTVDNPPVAVGESYLASSGTQFACATPGVLTNDSDADEDTLSAVKVTDPGHGTLQLFSTGGFLYNPTSGYHGPDSFTYKAHAGWLDSNTVTVDILVNDAPVANPDQYGCPRNGSKAVTTPGVKSNDSDAEGDTLAAHLFTGPSHGSLNSTFSTDGSFTYTPTADWSGTDTFQYRLHDGHRYGNITTVTIVVEQPPVANNDTYNCIAGATYTVPYEGWGHGVLYNDTDPEGATLHVGTHTSPQHGYLSLGYYGSFTYTPFGDYVGTDSFTYYAHDGYLPSNTPATVTIEIQAAPSILNIGVPNGWQGPEEENDFIVNSTFSVEASITSPVGLLGVWFDVVAAGTVSESRGNSYPAPLPEDSLFQRVCYPSDFPGGLYQFHCHPEKINGVFHEVHEPDPALNEVPYYVDVVITVADSAGHWRQVVWHPNDEGFLIARVGPKVGITSPGEGTSLATGGWRTLNVEEKREDPAHSIHWLDWYWNGSLVANRACTENFDLSRWWDLSWWPTADDPDQTGYHQLMVRATQNDDEGYNYCAEYSETITVYEP